MTTTFAGAALGTDMQICQVATEAHHSSWQLEFRSLATSCMLTVEGRLYPAAFAAPTEAALVEGDMAFVGQAAAGATPGACAACVGSSHSPSWAGRGTPAGRG